ncbi:hypothetical protein PAPYR_7028 [Paratrimastix pyriformis]|uniref:Uncharacterized protein n=1 Tax=Paratrimastix pyriformis TaxID=342808 RepID=A0ABQ8UJI7_9EUKA|nr:hypothetical protein PAPYR_7028 [Paratrimastix pyriformis]
MNGFSFQSRIIRQSESPQTATSGERVLAKLKIPTSGHATNGELEGVSLKNSSRSLGVFPNQHRTAVLATAVPTCQTGRDNVHN